MSIVLVSNDLLTVIELDPRHARSAQIVAELTAPVDSKPNAQELVAHLV